MAEPIFDQEYARYLDEAFDQEGYGLLLFNGDPIAWEVGLNEWHRESEFDAEEGYGAVPIPDEERE